METSTPAIAIIGCGYVGLTTAAILAHCGFEVAALEINPERLSAIKNGRSFFYEAGIDDLIKAGLDSVQLRPTDSYEDAIPNADIIFSCVGTPDNPDGSTNLTYVFQAAEQAATIAKDGAVFVQKSTVPVGTGEQVETLFAKLGKKLGYVSNPEFLREGTAVADTLWFDRIVVGSEDQAAADQVLAVYRAIEEHRDHVATVAKLEAPATIPETRYMTMTRASAELTKVTANAFLALKISFANSIAKLADASSADINEVMDAVGADHRIGRAFLNAGRGYGGGCFPKDVSGLIQSAEAHAVDLGIMRSVVDLNESMPGYIITKAMNTLGSSFTGKRVAVLGLSFKAGTSDTRRSPSITLANKLVEIGAMVTAFDPQANDEAKPELDAKIQLVETLEEACTKADCLFIATDWPELLNKQALDTYAASGASLLVDCMNRLSAADFSDTQIHYLAVGRS